MNRRSLSALVALFSLGLAQPVFAGSPATSAPAPVAPGAPSPAAAASCRDQREASKKLEAQATPEARKEAEDRFKRGVQFYQTDDFKLALIEFDRVYSLVPNFRTLYNIGQVNLQLNNYARALLALEAYLCQGGDDIGPERRAEIGQEIKSLKARTALLQVVTSYSEKGQTGGPLTGVDVTIDDNPMTADEQGRFLVDAGNHRLTARKNGYQEAFTSLTLAGGDEKTVTMVLEKDAIATGTEHTPTGVYIAWGGTAVLATATGLIGLLTLISANDLATARNNPDSSVAEREGKSKTATTFAIAADVLGVATIVAAGISVYVTIASGKKHDAAKMGLVVSPTSLGLAGSF